MGQASFLCRVTLDLVGSLPEVIAQVDVIAMRPAQGDDYVEMVVRKAGQRGKGFAPGYAQVAAVDAANAFQPIDCHRDHTRARHDDVDVDDGFRGQPLDSRAAYVLDRSPRR
jgi:hypothetical protein